MKAMESSQNFPMAGKVEVDESYVGVQDDRKKRGEKENHGGGHRKGCKRCFPLVRKGDRNRLQGKSGEIYEGSH
jgi:hypothetical protein